MKLTWAAGRNDHLRPVLLGRLVQGGAVAGKALQGRGGLASLLVLAKGAGLARGRRLAHPAVPVAALIIALGTCILGRIAAVCDEAG